METAFREIQNKVNECVEHDLSSLNKSLSLRLRYLEKGQRSAFLHQELFRITDELVQLRSNRVIESIVNYLDEPNFLWDSTLIEHLNSDERTKYRYFDLTSFSLDQYVTQSSCYDEDLPYFSRIIKFVVFSKYINLLKRELAFYQPANPNNDNKRPVSKTVSKEKPKTRKTFECAFNDQQIEILARCINEARIFTEPVTHETVTQIFGCELELPLRVKNNRLLAYLFIYLDDRSLITHNWQSVCEANQLFLSSLKGNILKQSDLSTATNQCRNYPPKDSSIIDNYLKELKKR